MTHRSHILVSHNVDVYVVGADGRVAAQQMSNRVVDAGINLLRDLIADEDVGGVSRVAVGTNATAVAAGQTSLFGEVYRASVTKTLRSISGRVTFKFFIPNSSANGHTLREAGLFNAASGGTMVARVVFEDPIPKDETKGVQIDWTITLEYKTPEA